MQLTPVITEELVDKSKSKCKINRTTVVEVFLSKQYFKRFCSQDNSILNYLKTAQPYLS